MSEPPRFLQPPPTEGELLDQAPDEFGYEWREVTCIICKEPMRVRSDSECPDEIFSMLAKSAAHQRCIEGRGLVENADRRGYRVWQVERRIPEEFRRELRFDLPGSSQAAFDAVLAWEYGQENLWLYGTPGRCKTRFAWQLIKREFVQHNREFEAGTHSHLRARFLTAMKENNGRDLGNLMVRFCTVPLLFIDDFGKGNITDAHEEWLYEIVDNRYRKGRPIIFTAQVTPRQICDSMRGEWGSAIMRRILERVALVDMNGGE